MIVISTYDKVAAVISLELEDHRDALYQWDTDRYILVNPDQGAKQLHFSVRLTGQAIPVDVVDGKARIPDEFLQGTKDLYVYAFAGTPESGFTAYSAVFPIIKRSKPADYVFTPTDQLTLSEIKAMVEDLREDVESGALSGVTDYNKLENSPLRPFPIREYDGFKQARIYLDDLEDGVYYYLPDRFSPKAILVISRENYRGGQIYHIRNLQDDPFVLPCCKRTTYGTDGSESIYLEDGITSTYVRFDVYNNTLNLLIQAKVNYSSKLGWLITSSNSFLYDVMSDAQPAHKQYVDTSIAAALNQFGETYVPPQSNWNTNDPEAAGYIVGRTHYEVPDPDSSTNALDWDGDTAGRPAVDLAEGVSFVRISDSTPPIDAFVGGTLTFASTALEQAIDYNILADHVFVEAGLTTVVLNNTPAVLIAYESIDMGEGLILDKGTYFVRIQSEAYSFYVSSVRCVYNAFGGMTVHPLAEKYIPETVARTKDIPTDDHINELIDTKLSDVGSFSVEALYVNLFDDGTTDKSLADIVTAAEENRSVFAVFGTLKLALTAYDVSGALFTFITGGEAAECVIIGNEYTLNITSIPTDEHINDLINAALGVIENGSY